MTVPVMIVTIEALIGLCATVAVSADWLWRPDIICTQDMKTRQPGLTVIQKAFNRRKSPAVLLTLIQARMWWFIYRKVNEKLREREASHPPPSCVCKGHHFQHTRAMRSLSDGHKTERFANSMRARSQSTTAAVTARWGDCRVDFVTVTAFFSQIFCT